MLRCPRAQNQPKTRLEATPAPPPSTDHLVNQLTNQQSFNEAEAFASFIAIASNSTTTEIQRKTMGRLHICCAGCIISWPGQRNPRLQDPNATRKPSVRCVPTSMSTTRLRVKAESLSMEKPTTSRSSQGPKHLRLNNSLGETVSGPCYLFGLKEDPFF